MNQCQICGREFDSETCPNCGEASYVIVAKPEPVKVDKKAKR